MPLPGLTGIFKSNEGARKFLDNALISQADKEKKESIATLQAIKGRREEAFLRGKCGAMFSPSGAFLGAIGAVADLIKEGDGASSAQAGSLHSQNLLFSARELLVSLAPISQKFTTLVRIEI